jgi:hypothetical protein
VIPVLTRRGESATGLLDALYAEGDLRLIDGDCHGPDLATLRRPELAAALDVPVWGAAPISLKQPAWACTPAVPKNLPDPTDAQWQGSVRRLLCFLPGQRH